MSEEFYEALRKRELIREWNRLRRMGKTEEEARKILGIEEEVKKDG